MSTPRATIRGPRFSIRNLLALIACITLICWILQPALKATLWFEPIGSIERFILACTFFAFLRLIVKNRRNWIQQDLLKSGIKLKRSSRRVIV
jgi:hypothetical protein